MIFVFHSINTVLKTISGITNEQDTIKIVSRKINRSRTEIEHDMDQIQIEYAKTVVLLFWNRPSPIGWPK